MAGSPDERCGIMSKLPHAESLPDGFTEGSLDDPPFNNGDGLACKLPLAEALPDGFTDGSKDEPSFTTDPFKDEPSFAVPLQDETSFTVNDSFKDEPSFAAVKEAFREEATFTVVEEAFLQMSLGSPPRAVQPSDVPSNRRFPVTLSEADASDVSDADDHRADHATRAASEKRGSNDITKTRKRRVRDVKAIMNAADKTSDEKLQLVHAKFLQQVMESEQLEKDLLLVRLKLFESNKEREALASDMSKSIILRQKLESLCRELQRQHKILSDESRRVAMEEHQKRQELSTKFHNTIDEISAKLAEQGDDRIRQAQENEMLREKLKHFSQQYEIREEHYSHQLKTKSLEHQLLEVKLKQQQELCAQEEAKARMYTEQISQLRVTEQDLRAQLALYGDKFEQFQETLTKSNEVFASFKQEMEKMSKTIKTLEKENFGLKKKSQKSDVSMIELLDERSTLKKQLETTTNQKKKLEALCRSLQAERKQHLLSASASTATPSPELPQQAAEQET